MDQLIQKCPSRPQCHLPDIPYFPFHDLDSKIPILQYPHSPNRRDLLSVVVWSSGRSAAFSSSATLGKIASGFYYARTDGAAEEADGCWKLNSSREEEEDHDENAATPCLFLTQKVGKVCLSYYCVMQTLAKTCMGVPFLLVFVQPPVTFCSKSSGVKEQGDIL